MKVDQMHVPVSGRTFYVVLVHKLLLGFKIAIHLLTIVLRNRAKFQSYCVN